MTSVNETVINDDPFPDYNPHVPSLVDMVRGKIGCKTFCTEVKHFIKKYERAPSYNWLQNVLLLYKTPCTRKIMIKFLTYTLIKSFYKDSTQVRDRIPTRWKFMKINFDFDYDSDFSISFLSHRFHLCFTEHWRWKGRTSRQSGNDGMTKSIFFPLFRYFHSLTYP